MAIKRGTNVEFVGTRAGAGRSIMWFKQQVKYYDAKHGVKLGDKGTVVRTKNGWFRVSWTRQDGTRVVSVPMRADHFTEKPAEKPEAEKVRNRPATPVSDLAKEEAVEEEMRVDPTCPDGFAYSRKDFVQFYGDTFVWDMVSDHQELPTREHQVCARLLKSAREQNEQLNVELADYSASMTELIAELDRVKLRLISSRTLMQLKDKTITELRGVPSFDRWGDWIVPEVGSG
jgi:hypothetical protein